MAAGSRRSKPIQRWFLRLEGIGHYCRDHIDHPVDRAAVPSVFNLADVLELVVHAFDQRPLPEQQLVEERHQFVFHVALQLGNQL